MKIRIRGKQWNLKRGRVANARGKCDHPEVTPREIIIASGLKGEEELEVLIHEMLHASFWDMDEAVIETVGEDLSKVLWKLGYRKTPK